MFYLTFLKIGNLLYYEILSKGIKFKSIKVGSFLDSFKKWKEVCQNDKLHKKCIFFTFLYNHSSDTDTDYICHKNSFWRLSGRKLYHIKLETKCNQTSE